MKSNPCYDVETKTSCPRRCVGCAITCNEWKLYEKERNENYGNKDHNTLMDNYECERYLRFKNARKKKKSYIRL